MTKRLPVTQWQSWTGTTYSPRPSAYHYVRYDRARGVHVFQEEGAPNEELFARRTHAPAGWHLRIGTRCYEFVASA